MSMPVPKRETSFSLGVTMTQDFLSLSLSLYFVIIVVATSSRGVSALFSRNFGIKKSRARDIQVPRRVSLPCTVRTTRSHSLVRSISNSKDERRRRWQWRWRITRREIERIRSSGGKLIVSLLTNRRGRVRVVTDVAHAKWPSSSFVVRRSGAIAERPDVAW